MSTVGIVSNWCCVSSVSPSSEPLANARNVSTSFVPYGAITYLINSFDYPNLLIHYDVGLNIEMSVSEPFLQWPTYIIDLAVNNLF